MFARVKIGRVPASALFIVIIIALVIGIICSSLIFISYYYKKQLADNFFAKQNQLNFDSGLQLLLHAPNYIKNNSTQTFDLYDQQTDSVTIARTNWGVWEVGRVGAFYRNFDNGRAFFFGSSLDSNQLCAIYLADYSRPLSVAGNTSIVGDCFLPESGVKMAYIEGQYFAGDSKLIQGKIKKSKPSLPQININLLAPIAKMLQSKITSMSDSLSFASFHNEDSTVVSFFDTTLHIHNKNRVTLPSKTMKGNIVLYSDTIVEIDADQVLNGIIIIASAIKVKKGFTGKLQLFAKDSIIIEEDCTLEYPSALGVFKVDYKVMQPFISIGKKSVVNGLLFTYQNPDVQDLQQTNIVIHADAVVTGLVYCDGFLDVKGTIKGCAMCNKFILKTPSTIYENHLLNATINSTQLSKYYVMPNVFKNDNIKKLMQWVD